MWIVKLMFSLTSELTVRGFKIDTVASSEDSITVLDFHKDNIRYNVSIDPAKDEQGEYLKLTGFMKKKDQGDTEYQVKPILEEFKSGDRLTIDYEADSGFIVILTKCIDSKFSMEGIDKEATVVIANEIIDIIVKTGTLELSVDHHAPASELCISSSYISVRDLDDEPIEVIRDPIVSQQMMLRS